MRLRNRLVLLGSIAAVAVVAVAVTLFLMSSRPTVNVGTFSVAIDYSPYFVAKSKGWFEEALPGVEVKYTTFQSLPPINEAFATDRLDFVFEAEPPAIIGRAPGNDIRVVAMSCALTQEIIVRTDSAITDPAQLRGKKIAVAAGSSSHYGLFRVLQDAGVPEDAVTILDMRPPDAKNAFEMGQVDAWAVWPPWPEQEIIAKVGRSLPGSQVTIHVILAARGAFLDAHPEQARAVVGALERAKEWIRQNPDEAQRLVAGVLDLDPQVVHLAWPKHNWSARLDDERVLQDIQAKADFLRAKGYISAPVNVRTDLVRPLSATP